MLEKTPGSPLDCKEIEWHHRLNGHGFKQTPGDSSVQFSSVTQSCPTLCNPMDCSTSGFPVHHQLSEHAPQEYIRHRLEEEQRQLEILQQQLLQEQALLLVTGSPASPGKTRIQSISAAVGREHFRGRGHPGWGWELCLKITLLPSLQPNKVGCRLVLWKMRRNVSIPSSERKGLLVKPRQKHKLPALGCLLPALVGQSSHLFLLGLSLLGW